MLTTDEIIAVGTTSGAIAVYLPASPIEGAVYTIKDASGNATTNNITVDTTDSTTIDGWSSFVISTVYGSLTLVFNGTQWSIV